MKYKVGDRVKIKSLDWYNKNKDSNGNVVVLSKVSHFSWCENVRTLFTKDMTKFCGKVVTIETVWTVNYSIVEGTYRDYFTDEMIECKVEEETKSELKFKVGDKITNGKSILTILTLSSDRYIVEDNFGECGTLCFNAQDYWKLVEEELQSKFNVGDVVYSRTWQRDVTIQEILPGGFYKVGDIHGLGWFIGSEDNLCKEKITLPTDSHSKEVFKHKISLPEGYQFVDDGGNVINATKIVLEKKKKEYPKTLI